MTAEMRQALDERSALIEAGASAVLDETLLAEDTWTRELGPPTSKGDDRLETACVHGCGIQGPLRDRQRQRARPGPANRNPATRCRSSSRRA